MAALTFENLAYGYYYVTSTMGSVITIDSTMKNVTIEDKNEEPSVEKAVLNATANEADYEESTTASIGDKVKFKSPSGEKGRCKLCSARRDGRRTGFGRKQH